MIATELLAVGATACVRQPSPIEEHTMRADVTKDRVPRTVQVPPKHRIHDICLAHALDFRGAFLGKFQVSQKVEQFI